MHRRNNEPAHGDYTPLVRFGRYPRKYVQIGTNIRISNPHNVRMLIERLHEVLDMHAQDDLWRNDE